MKPIYQNILIAVLVIAALVVSFQLGYYVAKLDQISKESESIRNMSKRIRELEARKKSRTSSDKNTEKPPKNE